MAVAVVCRPQSGRCSLVCRHVSVSILATENTSDDGAPAQHTKEVAAVCRSHEKEYAVVRGANHYYPGQPELLSGACQITQRFLQKRGLCDT
jgi:alpha/beta superfamily hydrolase